MKAQLVQSLAMWFASMAGVNIYLFVTEERSLWWGVGLLVLSSLATVWRDSMIEEKNEKKAIQDLKDLQEVYQDANK
jgi:hypothetical protein